LIVYTKRHQNTGYNSNTTEKLFQEMTVAWDSDDPEKTYGIIKKSLDAHPDVYRELLVKRNSRRVGKIEKLLNQNGKTLVIVGAGCLAGPDSVITLPAAKDFRITQK